MMKIPVRPVCSSLLCFFAVQIALFLFAASEDQKLAALPKGTSAIDSRGIEALEILGGDAKVTFVEVAGRPFTRAARLQTLKRPDQAYDLQFRTKITQPVKKGDALVAIFDARASEPLSATGIAQSAFVFELASAPYTKSADYPFKVGPSWHRYYVPFFAAADQSSGSAQVMFRLGYDPQTIEIGGLQVLNFGPGVNRDRLPSTPLSYIGRELDASWRKIAREKIERIRKGDLTIHVLDSSGKPVAAAKVTVRMKRHAFGWGSAVDARTLLGEGADNDRYRQHVRENCNRVVLENDLKWFAWLRDSQRAKDAVKWLRENNIDVRGHCLVWPGERNLPRSIAALFDQPDVLNSAINDHIREEAGAMRGQLIEWDVVNEPFSNFRVQAAMTGIAPKSAPDWIERHASVLSGFYRTARQADPAPKLYLNDYSILETGGDDAPHQEHFERTIRKLLADKAPLDGIGIQGHFSEDLTAIPRLWQILDRYAQFNLPIQITEFDVNTYDERLAADYTRDFLTAMFAHESVIGVLTWGFWEKRHWIPNAAFYRADWSPRPAATEWERLVRKDWWTNAEVTTDATGTARIRGFLGDYEVESGNLRQPATLLRPGTDVVLRRH
jgi:endo-1,4-beta-xylanase